MINIIWSRIDADNVIIAVGDSVLQDDNYKKR
jgi:hypothetical protein